MPTEKDPADFIRPLVINDLKGRVLKIPSQKNGEKAEILFIYGSHSSLERMFSIMLALAKVGKVTVPDLPGFGGMDSFYKIGKKPTLDNLADYLATYIKLEYKKRPIAICGMSFGFAVVTRMLQKYPEIAKQVYALISFVGFSNYQDFKFKKRNHLIMALAASFFEKRLPAAFFKYVVLRGPFIWATYTLMAKKNAKMKDADKDERNRRIKFEIGLWHCNDVRTYMETTRAMLTIDLTKEKVDLPMTNVVVDADQYFDGAKVKKNLKKIYKRVSFCKAKIDSHVPTVIASAKDAEVFIPKEVCKKLRKHF